MTHVHLPVLPTATDRHLQLWFLSRFLSVPRAQTRGEMGPVAALLLLLPEQNGFSTGHATSPCAVREPAWGTKGSFLFRAISSALNMFS